MAYTHALIDINRTQSELCRSADQCLSDVIAVFTQPAYWPGNTPRGRRFHGTNDVFALFYFALTLLDCQLLVFYFRHLTAHLLLQAGITLFQTQDLVPQRRKE